MYKHPLSLRLKCSLSLNLLLLAVEVLFSCWSQIAAASSAHTIAQSKAYAVFVASYNPITHQAIGGVAGTAFFVSPQRALTAYHVLQAASFKPQPGFATSQVWLVHENQPAIEIKAIQVHFQPGQDLTTIDFEGTAISQDAFLLPLHKAPLPFDLRKPLTTEGYVAGSTGPLLEAQGKSLQITSVPHLQLIRSTGPVLQQSTVTLTSHDVNLEKVPCLQVGYRPIKGLSGGPVLVDGQVVGMNSFADPQSNATASDKTWAVLF